MISFVEENVQNDSIFEGLVPHDYSGYTIIESAMDTINFVSEAFSDIQMSTLLEEYKYLYEHGEEIVYEEDESTAGAENSDATKAESKKSNILTKIVDAIKRWGERVYGMLQVAAQKIQAIATSISTKAGVSKKQFDAVDARYFAVVAEQLNKSFKKNPADIDVDSMLINDWNTENIPEVTTQDIVKEFINDGKPDGKEPWFSKQAVSDAVFGGYKNIGKKILDARKKVTKQMNDNIKAVKKAKTDDMASVMAKYNKAMKHNTAVIGGLLQVFAVYASQCKIIATGAIRYNKTMNKSDAVGSKTGVYGTKEMKKTLASQMKDNAKTQDKIEKADEKIGSKVHRYQSTKQELKDEKKAEKEAKKADNKNEKAGKKFFGRK